MSAAADLIWSKKVKTISRLHTHTKQKTKWWNGPESRTEGPIIILWGQFFCFVTCNRNHIKKCTVSTKTKMCFHFPTDESHLSVHNLWAAAAWQKSVKTRKAFPASYTFTHSTATARCTLGHSSHMMGACLWGNMESEGMSVQSIYYGRIGSEATETLLETFGREGSFLLRDSETVQGAYCLCVRWAVSGWASAGPKEAFVMRLFCTLVRSRWLVFF